MKVVKCNQVEKEPFPLPIFTSPDVTKQTLLPESQEYDMNIINFGRGVRNKFHAHDSEQILIVTYGKGIIATEKEERVIKVGDVVLIPGNEIHWHGATEDSEFSHIYITRQDSKLVQHED